MEKMVSVTYVGPKEEISVHVAGGFKVILPRNVAKLIPAQFASVFSGDEFTVNAVAEPKPKAVFSAKNISKE